MKEQQKQELDLLVLELELELLMLELKRKETMGDFGPSDRLAFVLSVQQDQVRVKT